MLRRGASASRSLRNGHARGRAVAHRTGEPRADEDQGWFLTVVILPTGDARTHRTRVVAEVVEAIPLQPGQLKTR